MNSYAKVLTGFEWNYAGKISMSKGKGYQGNGISRTLFLYPNIEDIPAELFALKISQSSNIARAGKPVFRFFSFRIGKEGKYITEAPANITMETPLEEIKAHVVAKLGGVADVQPSISVSMKGTFTTLNAGYDRVKLYDANEAQFYNADPMKNGDAPYYIKPDAIVKVNLLGATAKNNEYLRITLATDAGADDVLVKRSAAKIWGEDDSVDAAPVSAPSAPANNEIW